MPCVVPAELSRSIRKRTGLEEIRMHSRHVEENRGAAVAIRGAAVAAGAFGAVAAAVSLVGAHSGIGRALLVVLLLGTPGGAMAVMLRTLEPLARLLCALVAAVLVNAAVAQTMLQLEVWSISGGVAAVGVLSSLGWFLALRHSAIPVTARRAEPPSGATRERGAVR
jgi:hypothetical protein